MTRRSFVSPVLVVLAFASLSCGDGRPGEGALHELHRAASGDVEVILFATTAAPKPTRNFCTLEFRSTASHRVVDVESVHVRTTMTMEDLPMDGFVTAPRKVSPGRYTFEMVLAMSGSWTIAIAWDGKDKGNVTFSDVVR